MQTHDDQAVKVLNSLIETTLDSANGYKEAADNAEASQFRTLFQERSRGRLQLAQRLQEEVRSFGGEPETDQSLLGKAHNKFVDIKTLLMGGNDDKAVINEVERGEDFIKAKFQTAVEAADLPDRAQQVVTEAFGEIKAQHDEVSRLKHQFN